MGSCPTEFNKYRHYLACVAGAKRGGGGGGRKGKGKGAPLPLSPIPLPFFPSSLSPTPYPFRHLLRRLGITLPSPGVRSAQAASHDSVNVTLCKPGTINCPLAKCGNEITCRYSIVFTFKKAG